MNNPNEKTKYGIYLYPETIQSVDALYHDNGFRNRSEFVEKAIRFYCGYITADNYRDYFPSVIVSTMKGSLDSLEHRMASLLFKNAVELSMMLHVVAATHEIDKDTLSRLRGLCVNDVKRTNGHISLDEALRFQKGE